MQALQRAFGAVHDMVAIGDVMADRVARPGGSGDAAFGHQLERLAQRRLQPQRLAERLFAGIAAVNVRMIRGGHAQFDMLFNKPQQLLRVMPHSIKRQ